MTTRVIYHERIPSIDPRLKRHIHHDSESRRYPFPTAGLPLVSAKHTRHIPLLDQRSLGSCTGNAGISHLGTDPVYPTVPANSPYSLDEAGAVALYSAATRADDYPGEYPPEDTGSDGLTIAKVLKAAGLISGYQWTFSLDDALRALGVTAVMAGVRWYGDMFYPDQDGRVHITGSLAGGHEFILDEVDVELERVWGTQSWGIWGIFRDGRPGRFYLTFADFGTLLARQGDVTIFTPLTAPAPTPTPAPGDPADVEFARVLKPWATRWGSGCTAKQVKAAGRTWLTTKGL